MRRKLEQAVSLLFWLNMAYVLYLMVATIPLCLIDAYGTVSSGYARGTGHLFALGWMAASVWLSLRFQALRFAYDRFPWLLPLIRNLLAWDTTILLASMAVNWGYSRMETFRNVAGLSLALLIVIAGRVLHCWWFQKAPCADSVGGR